MSNNYSIIPCRAAKDGGPGPSRTGAPVLALPLSESAHLAVLERDFLALGERLRPAWRAEETERQGRFTACWRTGHYPLAPGTVVAVTSAGGRVPHRAYVAGLDGVAEISIAAAEDLLDPAGAGRRAWRLRVSLSGLKATPTRFRFPPGHGYEAETVYDWAGQEYVAVVTRAGPAYVWARAVTYAEAQALGIA